MLTQPISSIYGAKRFFGLLYEDAKLMQYTGLKDKNGKEIYEGDVVVCQHFNASEVKYDNIYAQFMAEDISFYDAEMTYEDIEWEVIGNIYENPELL
jgi:uncharacterized phage protein (TIGR01671 family)